MTQDLDGLCKYLPWDTDFFGYRIARILPTTLSQEQAEQIDAWCATNEIDCLYFMAKSNHAETVRNVEAKDYYHVDVRHVYEINLSKPYAEAHISNELTLDKATAEDTDSMLPMIDNAFVHTRFYYDPHFTQEQANHLYQTWLIRSIEEDFANQVLVARKAGIPQGFITCDLNRDSKIGSIGLIGVAEFARGQNLGANLVLSSFAYFAKEGMENIQVVTQGRNIAANRLYQKCGFRTSEVYLWYHKWFNKSR